VAFYRDVAGLELMARRGPHAAFLSAGGYHHHVGVNTWESLNAVPPPPGSAALRHASLLLPGVRERERVLERVEASGRPVEMTAFGPLIRDPSQNALVLTVA
jgi:catechol 2,3-dioxygenase